MSRSSLSRFPDAKTRAVAEHFPHANRGSLRVKKMVLILIVRAQFRRKPEFALVRSNLRRFRRLFAAAQSTAASKHANPLIKRGFLVWAGGLAIAARRSGFGRLDRRNYDESLRQRPIVGNA